VRPREQRERDRGRLLTHRDSGDPRVQQKPPNGREILFFNIGSKRIRDGDAETHNTKEETNTADAENGIDAEQGLIFPPCFTLRLAAIWFHNETLGKNSSIDHDTASEQEKGKTIHRCEENISPVILLGEFFHITHRIYEEIRRERQR
jgi:hypothetical protein